MAKFGFLYLHNGLWNGTQVIPKEWIMESTQKQITANATTDYGYLFWLQTIKDTSKDKEYFTYRAYGMGGQYIMVIPDLDSGSSSVPLSKCAVSNAFTVSNAFMSNAFIDII